MTENIAVTFVSVLLFYLKWYTLTMPKSKPCTVYW